MKFLPILIFFVAACTASQSSVPPESATATTMEIVPTEERLPAFVNSAELQITHSAPVKVILHVEGDLPTPCNQFAAEVAQPDAEKNIQVAVYSVVTTDAMCAQVLQPFDESFYIEIVNKFDGIYNVYVNGHPIGQIYIEGGNYAAVSM